MNNVHRRFTGILLMAGLIAAWGAPHPARADDGPTLNKTTVQIDVLMGSDYWAPDAAKSVNASCWIPHVTFQVRKPVPSGASCSITFTKPDGRPWVELPCRVHDQNDDAVVAYETPTSQELEPFKKKYTTAAGAFGFKINLHDELAGSDQVLFSGTFEVHRISRSQGTPGTKSDADYYVDHDWALPIGYLWFARGYESRISTLRVSTWLRGRVDMSDVGGYLYYQGKLIGSTGGLGGSLDHNVLHRTSDDRPTDPRWELWDLCFNRVHRSGKTDNSDVFILDKNPGEYEVKVLRKGELCRDLTFTVGPDGKIVDPGISEANHLGTKHIIVPVKVLGTLDGPWKQTAWKTDAFYGNPLTGFEAPQP